MHAAEQGPTTTRRRAGHALIAVMLVVIAAATLTPSGQRVSSTRWCVVCGDIGSVDVVLNILLFVPLGVGLAFARISRVRSLIVICGLTLVVETLQHFVVPGRDASIGDLLMNSLGGATGVLLGEQIDVLVRPDARAARRLATTWLLAWSAWQALVAFTFRPAPTDPPYYGQIRRKLGGRDLFRGTVYAASIDGAPIPNTVFDGTDVRRRLTASQGALLSVTVTRWGAGPRLAPIARIADRDGNEVLVIGPQRQDLVFGVRTGSSMLRLRPWLFRLPGAFARPAMERGGESLTASARQRAHTVELRAASPALDLARAIRLTPSQGWRLISPIETADGGTRGDAIAGAVWLAMLLIPAGYWLARAHVGGASRSSVIAIACVVPATLFGVPAVFGLYGPVLAEIAGAAAGMVAGAVPVLRRRGA